MLHRGFLPYLQLLISSFFTALSTEREVLKTILPLVKVLPPIMHILSPGKSAATNNAYFVAIMLQ